MAMMRKFILKREARRLIDVWNTARTGTYSAAVAYYTVFSLAPLLIIVIAIAGIVYNTAVVQTRIIDQFSSAFGPPTAELVRSLIMSNQSVTYNIITSIIGIVFVILGATGIFSALQAGFDAIFENQPKKKFANKAGFFFTQLSSLVMVFSLGVVLVVSILISSVLTNINGSLHSLFTGATVLFSMLDVVISYGLISLFLSLLLSFLPSEKIPVRSAAYGGLLGGALLTMGKYALSFYFTLLLTDSAYGAATSLVVIILWAFYLSQALFLSAIFVRLYFLPHNKK